MGFFTLRKAMREVELIETDFKPDTLLMLSLIERSSQKVSATLGRLRTDEADLERQINALTEELRQTRVAITAFDAAGAILEGTNSSAIADDPNAAGRKVPRMVSA